MKPILHGVSLKKKRKEEIQTKISSLCGEKLVLAFFSQMCGQFLQL